MGTDGADKATAKLAEAVGRHVDGAGAAQPQTRLDRPGANLPKAASAAKWVVSGAVGVLVLAVGLSVVEKSWLSKQIPSEPPGPSAASTTTPAATATISEKSIAVLPFTDMSEKKDQEYLADGMAEEILNLLAQVPDLLVPARTSSFYFKDKPTPIPEIARTLGVANILEGSIRRSGDHLRVTAQLVRADNGYHLWSQTYDRELSDIFKVQDEIADAVVQALQIKLMGGELNRQRGGTQNLEAYQLYLRAKSAINEGNAPSIDAATEFLEQAIKLDASYGLAWSGLSLAVTAKTDYGSTEGQRDGYEHARQIALHALQISPDLAEAHAELSYIYRTLDWDWEAAEKEGRRALSIDPTNPDALQISAWLSCTLGRWDDAERQLRLALTRDPLNTIVIWTLGTTLYNAGRYTEAEALFRRLLKIAPRFTEARWSLSKTLLAAREPEAALAITQQETNEGYRMLFLPVVLQATGQKAEADEAQKELIAHWKELGAYPVASAYAYRGDDDLAFQWLERAYQQRDIGLLTILGDPLFKSLVDDPRYKALLRRMNLPE